MKVWTNIEEFKATKPAVTIGSFDGIHLGHIEVLKQLKQLAMEQKGESVVFTFSPHPAQVLRPDKPFVMLSTIAEKTQRFEASGIDHLIIFPSENTELCLRWCSEHSLYRIKACYLPACSK